MRWIVGVDFKDRCRGALRLCRWVLDHGVGERVEAMHVLQEQDMRPLLPHVSLAMTLGVSEGRFAGWEPPRTRP